jgi:uncharacterized protein (TIGR02145 family)
MKNQSRLKSTFTLKNVTSLFLAASLFVALFTISSCRKDIEEVPLTSLLGEPKTQTVKGRVVDEQGNPVAGAIVKAGYSSQSTTTDQFGMFMLQSIKGYQKLGYIKVTKSGYLPGSRSFSPVKSGSNIVEIMLLQRNVVGAVSATSGGSVMAEGAKISFPANGFVKNGKAYTGNVNVAANFIDPTSPTLMQEMPGSLVGAMENQAYSLQSFGMIGVELTDDNGGKIDLAPDSKATINFPIPASILNDAPSTIQLWSFDELSGVWKHEGNAQKVNGQYVAEVGHFSYWNCDVPFNFVQVDGVLKDNQGNNLFNCTVMATSNSVNGGASVITNEFGQFSFQVPNVGSITLKAYFNLSSACPSNNLFLGTLNMGTLSSNTFINFIATNPNSLPPPYNGLTLTGQIVDCNNSPLADGFAMFNNNIVYADMNGNFQYFTCSTTPISFNAGSIALGLYSNTVEISYPSGTYDLGQVQACNSIIGGTGSVTDIDGNVYPTVIIAGVEWMASNLKTTKYNNGVPITNITSATNWSQYGTPGWCYYDNNSQYNEVYGKLYNRYVVIDSVNNVCPVGWHVSSNQEWQNLQLFFGGPQTAGGALKSTGTQYWGVPNEGATNSSGFSAMPGGYRDETGQFHSLGQSAIFYTGSYYYQINSTAATLIYGLGDIRNGYSIRCVKD